MHASTKQSTPQMVQPVFAVPLDMSNGSLGSVTQVGGTISFDTDALTYSLNGGLPIGGGRLITQDATMEKLHEILHDSPAGILVIRDELSGWLATLDKPGRDRGRGSGPPSAFRRHSPSLCWRFPNPKGSRR